MKLIVGLGNPDKDYSLTRHNVGFVVLDNYIGDIKWQSKFESLYTQTTVGGEKILLIKPQTYMNNSGISVRKFIDYFNVEIEDILIIQDDLDIAIGKYKIKRDSSSGGHNGIKSIINHLNTDSFLRLKVGISHSENGNTVDHVLGKITKREMEELIVLQNTFNEIIESFINNGIEKTMNIYNKRD